jgi:hypothetical protein
VRNDSEAALSLILGFEEGGEITNNYFDDVGEVVEFTNNHPGYARMDNIRIRPRTDLTLFSLLRWWWRNRRRSR